MQGGGESARQASTATGVAQNRAPGDIGQHGERSGPICEPRFLGDEDMLMISIQGGHEGDGTPERGSSITSADDAGEI